MTEPMKKKMSNEDFVDKYGDVLRKKGFPISDKLTLRCYNPSLMARAFREIAELLKRRADGD